VIGKRSKLLPSTPGRSYRCPICQAGLDYHGPLQGVRFACPNCSVFVDRRPRESKVTWLTWRETGERVERYEMGDPLCRVCGSSMTEKPSKFDNGTWWACDGWPKCKKGKAGRRPRVKVVECPVALVAWVAGEPTELMLVDRERWRRAEERKKALKRRQWA
jgi:hypothetical protein